MLSLAFSPDGKRLATTNFENTIEVWDVSSGRAFFTLKGHSDWVESVGFNPDGKPIVMQKAQDDQDLGVVGRPGTSHSSGARVQGRKRRILPRRQADRQRKLRRDAPDSGTHPRNRKC